MINEGDKKFLDKAMSYLRIRVIKIGWSDSKEKYPDLWCYPKERPPRIVVTQEWKKQSADERRSRLTHELLHVRGLQHGRIGKYNYSTYPVEDTYSKAMYRHILSIMG